MGYTEKVVVVGAGISGLACAYRLRQLGIPCVVLEAKERAGGVVASIRKNGYLFEAGPQFPRFPAAVWQLVKDLHLEGEFVAGDPKAKRYIFRHGELHPAPFSPTGLIKTRLVGVASKVRILTEAFGSSHPPEQEESLAEFVQRKFGSEILDNVVDPVISTIFFGDAQKMGMESAFPALVQWERNHGSLVRGAIRARKSKQNGKTDDSAKHARANGNGRSLRVTDSLPSMGSFRTGMGRLPERLAEELKEEIRYKVEITSVGRSQNSDGGAKAEWQIGLASGEKITTKQLVLAAPAYAARQMLASSEPQLAAHLQEIEYAPMCAVASAYDRSQVEHTLDGFGFMVPRREGLHTICTFWNSSLFPQRAPRGKVLITSFAGRANEDARTEEYAKAVEAENARALGITGEPADRMVWSDSRALPQYNVGHARRVAEIDDILRTVRDLHIAGNFLKGRSIGDCVETGFAVAENVRSRLQRQDI